VVLTVGSDCNVGKMTVAIELQRELERRGARAAFVATGQTGIFIADRGVAVDAVPADFVAGVVEDLVVEAAADHDVVVVEGQGALHHPGYSGVTLGLLHGACPRAMVLCHHAGRTTMRSAPGEPIIPPLRELVEVYERAAAWVHPSQVIAVALDTHELSQSAAIDAMREVGLDAELPVTDPVRFSAAEIADALQRAMAASAAPASPAAKERSSGAAVS
jgi:uncharacterized NAD-dependent epimerase/dehydratase family protein